MAADCPECGGVFMDGPHPNYDHLHGTTAERLPRARRTDSRVVTRGYAVGMSGFLPQFWVFFDRIEPAYAFGRAGRMAPTGDITSYGVYEAAHEVRWDEGQVRDVRTLHVATDTSLREHADDKDLLTRWLRGTAPQSAYYQPPGSEQALAAGEALLLALRGWDTPGSARCAGMACRRALTDTQAFAASAVSRFPSPAVRSS
jgi:hypothetical protein